MPTTPVRSEEPLVQAQRASVGSTKEVLAARQVHKKCGAVIGLPRELGVRRKLLVRFPYSSVFVEAESYVRIISVMHGHRRPAYWRRRR